MNITEANDVNRLLEWVLDVPKLAGDHCTDDEAVEVAAHLADRAYKALYAGRNGDAVRAAWPNRPPRNTPRDTPREAGDG